MDDTPMDDMKFLTEEETLKRLETMTENVQFLFDEGVWNLEDRKKHALEESNKIVETGEDYLRWMVGEILQDEAETINDQMEELYNTLNVVTKDVKEIMKNPGLAMKYIDTTDNNLRHYARKKAGLE